MLPILENLLDTGGNVERFHDWLHEQAAEFGHRPWKFAVPGRPATVVLSSPDAFEDVLKTQADVFLRGPTASHFFSMQMMKDVMEATVREKLVVFVDVLSLYAARGAAFGIKEGFSHFTMDTIAKIGFGLELDTLKNSPDHEDDHEFLQAFDKASVAFGVRFQSPRWLWELKKYLNVGWEKVFVDNTKIIHRLIGNVIVQSMNNKAELAAKGSNMNGKDLVTLFMESKLMETQDMHIEDDDATIMRDMVVTFIFARKDSTAHSMGWLVVNLNHHPQVLQKIRNEMKEKVPGLLNGEIEVPPHEQIHDLVSLEAAVRENIRPNHHDVNGRNKKTWGEDAQEFKPEWMIDPATGKLRVVSPFVFSSFGSGRHVCIGQKFAMMEIKLAMATLLSKFDIKTIENPWKLTYEFSLTIPVKGPLDVEVTPLAM
ncbi:hypothetical protein PHYPSEUDO_005740 [Phytophthora pseudosyringae]|uniref:Cytochrome P450 n=1 Tax=Phytophthora pseudosyringae TaxID=221518 RepID=A0A8T1VNQ1_9STRA|nr:hypothetical protein PHYPSEUDO_005740 [Phytophthora pseudosyringae]